MGEWIPEMSACWQWFHCPTDKRIYHREAIGWRVYAKQPSRVQRLCSLRFTRTEILVNEIPEDVDMETISISTNGVKITGACAVTPRTDTPLVIIQESLEETLDAANQADKWAVELISVKDNG